MPWMPHQLLMNAFSLLRNPEKPLPSHLLRGCVSTLLSRRDLFLQSTSQFRTPQYFFDEPALSSGIDKFHDAFSTHLERFRLFYAVKSNSFPGISRHVVQKGHGLDVSSGDELSVALRLGCERIIFSGPGKTDEELRLASANRDKVTLLVDSGGELERLSRIVTETGPSGEPVRIGIRVRGTYYGIWEKFGISLEELGPLFNKAVSTPGVDPQGIQFHTSWNLNPEAQVKMIRATGFQIRKSIPEGNWKFLRFLDIGGGYWPEAGEWLNLQNTFRGKLIQLFNPDFEFKLRHHYKPSTPIGQFAKEISKALSEAGHPVNTLEIWMEPGRWLSTPCMHILLRVIDRKGPDVVITDGGINLLGWERPLTEFIPVINLARPSLQEIPFRIFGSLCTPLDVWGTSVFGEGVLPGDILLVPNQGAYTYSLRQSFIKPIARVIRFDGSSFSEAEPEQKF